MSRFLPTGGMTLGAACLFSLAWSRCRLSEVAVLTGDTAVSEIHHDRASPRGSIKTEILAPVIHARHAFLHTLPPLSLFERTSCTWQIAFAYISLSTHARQFCVRSDESAYMPCMPIRLSYTTVFVDRPRYLVFAHGVCRKVSIRKPLQHLRRPPPCHGPSQHVR
ncbi:hypothetical protein IG631_21913 [Alternaria alternata]|nr:hypothetical protein IG631_21913 [Alternaria alternata]